MGAIILSAGRSLRMGTTKALLPWGPEPLLAAWVRRFAEVGLGPVVVVLNPDGAFIRATVEPLLDPGVDVRWAENPAPDQSGLRESLLYGLDALPAGHDAFFTPVDVPVVPAEALRSVRVGFEGASPVPLAAVPQWEGAPGHPVLAGPDLVQRLFQGEHGDRVDQLLAWATRRLLRVEVPYPEVAADMDTPEDYARWAPGE